MADVNYKIGADATAVVQEIGKVRKSLTGLGKLRWSELAMGVQAVMANLALLKNAAVGAFNAVIKPAAEVEQYMHARLCGKGCGVYGRAARVRSTNALRLTPAT